MICEDKYKQVPKLLNILGRGVTNLAHNVKESFRRDVNPTEGCWSIRKATEEEADVARQDW